MFLYNRIAIEVLQSTLKINSPPSCSHRPVTNILRQGNRNFPLVVSQNLALNQNIDQTALQHQVLSTACCQVLPFKVLLLTGNSSYQGCQNLKDGTSWTFQGSQVFPYFCCPLHGTIYLSTLPSPNPSNNIPPLSPMPTFNHCSFIGSSCLAASHLGVSWVFPFSMILPC